jgi:hypothetical protein
MHTYAAPLAELIISASFIYSLSRNATYPSFANARDLSSNPRENGDTMMLRNLRHSGL